MPIILPNAVVGAVVTRFPPEPSWVLDLGHCKASLTNQYIATQFKGRWILRFDDTNPKTCSRENVAAYLRDLPLLDLHPSRITYASDYFQQMVDTATVLIEAGFLYADDTPTEEMRVQRMAKQLPPQRNSSTGDNLAAWGEMQAGSPSGQQFCLRFRLDPTSENGVLRDPVAWRGVDIPHYKTGNHFRVYPTYDFAAPWLDLAEGVTHALRTLEFRDRDVLYNAVQQAILKVHPEWVASNIWEFPRIHMSYTPQAKVHQKALLAAGLVEGPSDPRLPTLRGLMRAGCHPDALKAFLLEQVSPARKETYHSWDKLWTLNRRLLDPTSARHMAVLDKGRVLVTVLDGPSEPQPQEVTWKQGHVVRVVPYRQIWIDQEDAQMLLEGDDITLLAWGNAVIQSISRAAVQQQQQQQQGGGGAEAGFDASAHVQLQQQQQQQSAVFNKPPVASQPSPNDSQESTNPSQAEAAAGAAAAAVFEGFTDVLALRDELQRQRSQKGAAWCSSSCASTAGSASVAALASLPAEADNVAAAAAAAAAAPPPPPAPAPPPAAAADTHSMPVVTSMSVFLNTAGDPKASKLKLHWLPNLPEQLLPLRLVRFGHPVLVEKVTEDVDVLANFNHNSRSESVAWGDPSLLLSARRGNVVQLQRKGFYIIDKVLLKQQTVQDTKAAAAAAAAAAVGAGGGDGGGQSDFAGKTLRALDTVSTDVVVPIGAEAAAAAAETAAAVKAAVGSDQQRQQQSVLQAMEVQEIVMFYIPDGHKKHNTAS